jgi:hypothetical protein
MADVEPGRRAHRNPTQHPKPPARGRPVIDDRPLARAIVVLVRTGGEGRTVCQLAARWLCKQRGINPRSARERVATSLRQLSEDRATRAGHRHNGAAGTATDDSIMINFGFVLAAVSAIHGKATARRLREGGARAWCLGWLDDEVSMFMLAGKIGKARRPAVEIGVVITISSQKDDLITI